MELDITFRRVDLDRDLPFLFAWLADEDVHHWYDEGEHSLENYRHRFAPEPTVNKFIVEIDGTPVGYLQTYWLSDEPDYASQLGLEHDAVSIDVFIGEAAFRNRGLGSTVLRAALSQIVFGEMGAEHACINPAPENIRAIKSYEKAGFVQDRIVYVRDSQPENTGHERIMLQSREAFLSRIANTDQ
ncbi:MAG: acetyltransferase [Thermomicrobiales bacterium]|nr:acetyltransferase [Thermomicrobiales bacterium]